MRASPIPVVVLALAVLPGCHGHHGEHAHHPTAKIIATSPIVKDVVITRQYVAQIRAQENIEVKPLVSGYLDEIAVTEGQTVKEGQVLFKILPVLYKATLDAEVAEAKLAEIEYQQSKKLKDQGVVSAIDVALNEAKWNRALAKVKKAEAELQFTTITARFDGIVDRLLQRRGSLVKESDVLTMLYDTRQVWVRYNVPEAAYLEYKAREQNGETEQTELVLANGNKFAYPAQKVTVMSSVNPETGNAQFRADFPNPTGLLRHGQTGTVLIHRWLRGAVIIPQRATFEILDKVYVYVIDSDGVAHQHEIKVVHEQEDVYLVGPGLGPEDKIVVEGVREVHDGQKVEATFRPADQILGKQKFRAE